MKNKVLVIGAAFVDVIMNISKLPVSGGDVTANLKKYVVGGSAFNVFGALKYLNAQADLLVPVGKGQYADMVRKELNKRKIPILLERDEKDNGWDLCLVEKRGERTFITVQGIDQMWTESWFSKITLNDYKYFYISGYETENFDATNSILNYLDNRREDSYILFDASPRVRYISPEIMTSLLHRNVIVHCNEDEIDYISNKDTFDEKLDDIYDKTNCPVLVTLGARGTCVYDHGVKVIVEGEKPEVVNTIGAGDTHCGGVLSGLQEGLTIQDAVKLGNHVSSLVVQQESGSL